MPAADWTVPPIAGSRSPMQSDRQTASRTIGVCGGAMPPLAAATPVPSTADIAAARIAIVPNDLNRQ